MPVIGLRQNLECSRNSTSSFRRPDVGGPNVLVAKALNLVLSTFLIKTNFSGRHDLTAAIALSVELYLKIAERVVGCASVSIKLNERHGTSGNDGDDGVGALSAFACDRELIAGGANNGDAALIFFL